MIEALLELKQMIPLRLKDIYLGREPVTISLQPYNVAANLQIELPVLRPITTNFEFVANLGPKLIDPAEQSANLLTDLLDLAFSSRNLRTQ
jgi:hypothetical protein